MIRLYNKPECPFCYRVRVLLNYLGVEYESLQYDEPEYDRQWRALTHASTVPVLVTRDLVMTDSGVMLEYLQDRYGGLLPEGVDERARARALVYYADNPLGRGSREVVFAKRSVPREEWDSERIAAGTRVFNNSLQHLENVIRGQDNFAGRYGMADAALSSRLALSAAYGLGIPSEFEALRGWFGERIAEPFFVEASPPVVQQWLQRGAESAVG